MTDNVVTAALERRLELSTDEDEKRRIRDALAEQHGMALTGDAHGREGAVETS